MGYRQAAPLVPMGKNSRQKAGPPLTDPKETPASVYKWRLKVEREKNQVEREKNRALTREVNEIRRALEAHQKAHARATEAWVRAEDRINELRKVSNP